MSEVSLADHFNCSSRQLQRKLKDEGTSYRELLDKVRMDLAEQYITRNNFTITETAYLLGYSDPNNFSRAFKKWMGVSPGSFRNKLAPKGAF
jgi:AraC-like DNA-binding protein